MSRVTNLKPRVQVLGNRVKPLTTTSPTYGQGRGGRPWRRKRERILERDAGLCQPCLRMGKLTLATEVDHIVPKSEGGRDNDANLQAICCDCHKAKTAAETRHART